MESGSNDCGIRPTNLTGTRSLGIFVFMLLLVVDAGTALGGRAGGGTPSVNGSTRARICDVPTDGNASPTYGIGDFEQQMLRFEEFGKLSLDQAGGAKVDSKSLPAPESAYGFPNPEKIDEFLKKPLYPFPLRDSNKALPNPWQSVIEATHTGPLTPLAGNAVASFADGRPPGAFFGHQRWAEFFPRTYVETVVTGSRVNRGARDSMQSHLYIFGEFGPGSDGKSGTSDDGLYHSVYAYSGPVHPSSPLAADVDPATGLLNLDVRGTTDGIPIALHPKLPIQDSQSVWTFDGSLPPKLLLARLGEPILFRNYNGLPIKFESNRGFGNHFISTHEHNGHNPAESDGFAQAYFLPGQFYDYIWPMVLAGHDTINTDRSDNRASLACDPGERITVSRPGTGSTIKAKLTSFGIHVETCPAHGKVNISGNWRETMSTHWFHDHMVDYTAQNVYKGNAAMMNYYSGLDRGNECWNDGVNLRFPSGCGEKYGLPKGDQDVLQGSKRSWAVRDYDVQLSIASKAWGQDPLIYPGGEVVTGKTELGDPIADDQLWFAPFNSDGFVGDRLTVNWLYKPYFDVRARRYRFRILNADVSRFLRLALVVARKGNGGEFEGEDSTVSYDRVPFHMIANDGNVMEHAIPFDGSMDLDDDAERSDHHGVLPTLSIAERYDIVVDFENFESHEKIYMVNLLEHADGRGPEREISLGSILDGTHDSCDSAVGKFLEFRVHEYEGKDLSMNPEDYVPGKSTMIPMPALSEEEVRGAVNHTFRFGPGGLSDSRPRGLASDFYPVSDGKSYVESPMTPGEGRELPNLLARQPTQENQLGEFIESCHAYDLEDTDAHLLNLGLDFNDYMNEVPLFSVADKEQSILEFHPKKSWGVSSDGGLPLAADLHRVASASVIGGLEIWHLENTSAMWSHNIHIHFEEGRILRRDGKAPPEWEKWARKDVYRLGNMDDSGSSVDIALRFREFAGTYMSHCHNTTHEDHAMLMRFDIENPGQLKTFLTPEPQWNGTSYSESHEEKHASQRSDRRGDVLGKRQFDQENIEAMLCPSGATGGCPGADSDGGNGQSPVDVCDIDGNGQVDSVDIFQMIRTQAPNGGGSTALAWASCVAKCTHRGCSPFGGSGGRCGLVGLEGILILLPLAVRRKLNRTKL
jgi:hypothetical protein